MFNLPSTSSGSSKTGIGEFIEQGKDGFQIGPGTLKPEFNVNDGSFGLTFKMPIAQLTLKPSHMKTEPLAEFENRTQLE